MNNKGTEITAVLLLILVVIVIAAAVYYYVEDNRDYDILNSDEMISYIQNNLTGYEFEIQKIYYMNDRADIRIYVYPGGVSD